MARSIQVSNVADFTGGLNLRANGFQLAVNESPNLLNVDVDPRGGVRMRKVVAPYGSLLPDGARSLLSYETTGGVRQVIAQAGSQAHFSTGGNWTSFGPAWTGSSRLRGATFKDKLYLQNGLDAPYRWDGAAGSTLTHGYNDNLEAPVGGNMPIAKTLTVHQGSVWVANTREGGTDFPNRVRWSHPNFPEDYRSFDFIDIDTGSDGDVITALVPFGDRLLVFKRKSIHAIYGQGPDGYQVFPVTREVGAVSQEGVVNTDVGLYFFSWPEGVFLYDGRQPKWVFERLYPAIQDGFIPDERQDEITLGWADRRLWVNVPFAELAVEELVAAGGFSGGYAWLYAARPALMDPTPTRTFVLDPSLGKEGSWTMYRLPVGPFLEWKPPGADSLFLAAAQERKRVVKLDQDGAEDDFGDVDSLGRPIEAQHVPSHYQTRFYDLAQPAVVKRWRAPEFVLHRQSASVELRVETFVNYNPGDSSRNFRIRTDSQSAEGVWDVSQWDAAKWAGTGSNRNVVVRGGAMGSSRSISMLIHGPDERVPWGLDSIVLKYIPKKVRG